MRILLLALGALVIIGGVVGGGYYYFTSSAEAAGPAAGEHAAAEEKAGDEASGAGHAGDHAKADAHQPYPFVEFEPLIVPVIDESGVSQVISLVIAVEVMNGFDVAKVQAMAPKLKNAYIQDMYGILNRHASLQGGVLEIERVKERLNAISQRIMGENIVHGVKLQVVQQRPV